MTPGFSPDVKSYTAATSNSTNKVKAVCDDETATITLTLNGATVENNTSLTWASGENELLIVVTGTSGLTTRYAVTVTKT